MKKSKGLGTRLLLGVGILLSLLAMAFFGQRAVAATHTEISQMLSQAGELALSGDFSQGKALAQAAQTQWEENRRWTAVLADQTPMEEADRLFAQIRVYSRENIHTEFASCCLQLAELIHSIVDAHTPHWWSVL